jgi:chromosome segregation ATPase
MNRLTLVRRMDDLLDQCKLCPIKNGRYKYEKDCVGCQVYTELRSIGNRLERGKDMKRAVITQENYRELKENGLTEKQAAEKLGISTATLWNHKKKWNQKPKQVDTAEKTPPETKTTKMDVQTNMRQLIDELGEELKQERKKNKELQESFDYALESNEEFSKVLSERESEFTSLMNERNGFRDQLLDTRHQLHQKDYTLENLQKGLANAKTTLERYEAENKALRALVQLWV